MKIILFSSLLWFLVANVSKVPKDSNVTIETDENKPMTSTESREECVICPQVMPKCKCSDPKLCLFAPQTCHHCATYVCAHEEDLERPHRRKGEMTGCVCCIRRRPICECTHNEICKIFTQTCRQCSKSYCQPIEWKDCENNPLEDCDCKPNQFCNISGGSPTSCPRGECIRAQRVQN